MRIAVSLTHDEIKKIIQDYVEQRMEGNITRLAILSNSKQNYKATWEICDIIVANQEAIEDHNNQVKDNRQHYPQIIAEIEITK